MKAFCLEKALAGSPVMLKNGCKGFIKFEIPSRYNFAPSSALGGYWINNRDVAITENWRINGTHFDDSNLNIIGMYEESNNYESNQMKKFDLEKALAGEPVRLRDGSKAFVMFRKPEKLVFTHDTELVGYVISGIHAVTQSWSINGLYQENEESDADIVGMWEEPRPTVTLTLPCPLKELEEGQKFWRITMNSDPLGIAWAKVDVGMSVFDKENVYHLALLDAGLAFKSEEDAQAWFDAMKNARR